MKKLFCMLLMLMLLTGCASAEKANVAALKGPTAIGMVKMMEENAIDAAFEGKPLDPVWRDEVEHISNRHYSTGFFYGQPGQYTENSRYVRDWQIVAKVESCDEEGNAVLSLNNKFASGDVLELVGPDVRPQSLTVGTLIDAETGEELTEVKRPQMKFKMKLPCQVPPLSLLRRQAEGL
jgi:putative protease